MCFLYYLNDLFWSSGMGNDTMKLKEINDKFNKQTRILFKVVDKLEGRIATLEKVIGKLQLRLGDVVLYIDKREENNEQ